MQLCSRHPEVLWAQRSDKVYLTIALPDAHNVSVKCEPEGLFSFSAVGVQGETFDVSLELYGRIVPEVSIYYAGSFFLLVLLPQMILPKVHFYSLVSFK